MVNRIRTSTIPSSHTCIYMLMFIFVHACHYNSPAPLTWLHVKTECDKLSSVTCSHLNIFLLSFPLTYTVIVVIFQAKLNYKRREKILLEFLPFDIKIYWISIDFDLANNSSCVCLMLWAACGITMEPFHENCRDKKNSFLHVLFYFIISRCCWCCYWLVMCL